MDERYSDETRFREAIRAASPRCTTPQVRLRERRRRERRAVAEMAVYCLGLSAVLVVVLCTGAMTIDLRMKWPVLLLLFAGAVGVALTAWSDRIAEVWRKL